MRRYLVSLAALVILTACSTTKVPTDPSDSMAMKNCEAIDSPSCEPTIDSITPASAVAGTPITVTIYGKNLRSAQVIFGSLPGFIAPTDVSDDMISFIPPVTAPAGDGLVRLLMGSFTIRVYVPGHGVSNPVTFTYTDWYAG